MLVKQVHFHVWKSGNNRATILQHLMVQCFFSSSWDQFYTSEVIIVRHLINQTAMVTTTKRKCHCENFIKAMSIWFHPPFHIPWTHRLSWQTVLVLYSDMKGDVSKDYGSRLILHSMQCSKVSHDSPTGEFTDVEAESRNVLVTLRSGCSGSCHLAKRKESFTGFWLHPASVNHIHPDSCLHSRLWVLPTHT